MEYYHEGVKRLEKVVKLEDGRKVKMILNKKDGIGCKHCDLMDENLHCLKEEFKNTNNANCYSAYFEEV